MHKEHALLSGKQYVNENRDEETDWDVARGHNLQTGYQKHCSTMTSDGANRMLEKETDVGGQMTAV